MFIAATIAVLAIVIAIAIASLRLRLCDQRREPTTEEGNPNGGDPTTEEGGPWSTVTNQNRTSPGQLKNEPERFFPKGEGEQIHNVHASSNMRATSRGKENELVSTG